MDHPHTNALINETSPYLLQHAHNPVSWFPWGEDALSLAKEQDKPILVSIGYSACHWCHVMERESFENELVAEFMNRHFINIKIDREERPDLDHIYMEAVQIINGNGGWPLNVFLTTDARPFYGGTYFPPKPAFNKPSWLDVLHFISDVWNNRRTDVENQAEQLINHIASTEMNFIYEEMEKGFFNNKKSLYNFCREIRNNILKLADTEYGGFGAAPKFPQFFSISYLLEYSHFHNDEECEKQALLSIDSMLDGGIYDQIGGGLARYSTDNEWHAPHFEKMLYDNALLIDLLSDAYLKTGKDKYKNAIIETIDFCTRELKCPMGGYYAAIDADSEGVEGKYYVWNYREIQDILDKDFQIFCEWYNVTQNGNWDGTNILHPGRDKSAFAKKIGLTVEELDERLSHCRNLLMKNREKRIRPQTDDKILLGWNALLVSALCKAATATGNNKYKLEATSLFQFLEKIFTKKSFELLHDYKSGIAKNPAFLDDYAYMIKACIQLQEITADESFLIKAKDYTEHVLSHFSKQESPFLCYTATAQSDVPLRKVEIYDSALPSGNSIMAQSLLYLAVVFDKTEWELQALQMIELLSGKLIKYPSSFGVWARIILQHQAGNIEIVLTGDNFENLLGEINRIYIPNKKIQASTEYKIGFPLLQGKKYGNKPLIYVCKGKNCFAPQFDFNQVIKLLK